MLAFHPLFSPISPPPSAPRSRSSTSRATRLSSWFAIIARAGISRSGLRPCPHQIRITRLTIQWVWWALRFSAAARVRHLQRSLYAELAIALAEEMHSRASRVGAAEHDVSGGAPEHDHALRIAQSSKVFHEWPVRQLPSRPVLQSTVGLQPHRSTVRPRRSRAAPQL